jgi:hypothetical protein
MKRLILVCGLALTLAACTGDGGDQVAVVQNYLQAKVEGDTDTIRSLLCAEMEAVLERETRTFESVSGVTIEDMSCQLEAGSEGTVRCQGKIIALYGTEQTEFPLTSYRVVEEDGQWKWCGEAP